MSSDFAKNLLISTLSPRYGEGEAKAIARIVFEDAFDYGRAFDEKRFQQILERLESGEPVQYVLGSADFFGLKFKVNPAVLIPRQETEELVAWVLEELKANAPLENPAVFDIGIGSGCIGITLKKKRPGIQLFGVEKSEQALAMALENVSQVLGTDQKEPPNVQFFQGDILDHSEWPGYPDFDLVVSNPPYIPYAEKALIPDHVLQHEPALALFVENDDPLLFYREIAAFARVKLKAGGLLFFECNEFNASDVVHLLREKGFKNVILRHDLAGAPRMIKADGG